LLLSQTHIQSDYLCLNLNTDLPVNHSEMHSLQDTKKTAFGKIAS